MTIALITGGSGFFGQLLKERLLENNYLCINVDLQKDDFQHPNLISIQGDIRNADLLEDVCKKYKIEIVFHCAAMLAHAVKDKSFLWESNVNGTKNIAEIAKKYRIPKIVFTSSNCLWAENFHRPIREDDIPKPVEIYGKSKWEAENILLEYTKYFDVIIFRCPTIIDTGRLGLLTILFEFIDEGRKVWVVGGGSNRYQFIYAQDLVDACLKAREHNQSDIFNIGSDHVKTFKEVFTYVINKAQSRSKIVSVPKKLSIGAMKIAYMLKISPLGPYQYKMIAEDFVFDTSKIKEILAWRPTLTNEEMLGKAYQYYHEHREEIFRRKNVSAHKRAVNMGIIKLLKWFS